MERAGSRGGRVVVGEEGVEEVGEEVVGEGEVVVEVIGVVVGLRGFSAWRRRRRP